MSAGSREEMERLAEMIAKKMLEKKGVDEIIRLANNYCKDTPRRRGLIPRADISSEDARFALNELHFAVNGIRPYPRRGACSGDLSNDNGPCAEYDCNGTYDGPRCIEEGEFNPCECGGAEGFSNPTGPCAIPDAPWLCMTDNPPQPVIFKCDNQFDCGENFTGCGDDNRYCVCGDGNCPAPSMRFYCKLFSCSGLPGRPFDCALPGSGGEFGCSDSGSQFDCHVEYSCTIASYICEANRYSCKQSFVCQPSRKFDCKGSSESFICQGASFTCGSVSNICRQSFSCSPPFQFNEEEDCLNDFFCDPPNAFQQG